MEWGLIKAEIKFDVGGIKKLLLRFAKLDNWVTNFVPFLILLFASARVFFCVVVKTKCIEV
jgi:hypothetical protein